MSGRSSKSLAYRIGPINSPGYMNKNRGSGYAITALAFWCGYFVAGVIFSAYGMWGLDSWDRGHSATQRFAFIESLIFVVVFGILSTTAYFVGAVVRSVRLTSPDCPRSSCRSDRVWLFCNPVARRFDRSIELSYWIRYGCSASRMPWILAGTPKRRTLKLTHYRLVAQY
jgi:hypothetical protein